MSFGKVQVDQRCECSYWNLYLNIKLPNAEKVEEKKKRKSTKLCKVQVKQKTNFD